MGPTNPAVVPPITARIPTGPGWESHGAPIWVFIHIPRKAKTAPPTKKPIIVRRITRPFRSGRA